MAENAKKHPWLVRMHHRMRTVSFGMVFAATSLQILDQNYRPLAWLLLVLLLLVYPHVQYWRACRAENPIKAEMNNLLIDSVLLGIFIAGIGFSLWLSFSVMLGTLTNNTANKGWRSLRVTLPALASGILLGVAAGGFRFTPDTTWPATIFCMLGLTGYLTAMGNIGFSRNIQLRSTREALKNRESELLTANETLLKNLQEIDQLHQQMREQATHDALTGLYNRRYLDSTLERELSRCKRDGQALSLIMIDLDHFKRINDTYGHQAGDAVLTSLGAILLGIARSGDVACRYGGEEFLLLMPTMSLGAAHERAEELRQSFAATTVAFGNFQLQATLSIGVAVYPGHGITAEDLIRCADKALYQAKQNGRNRVCIAPGANAALEVEAGAPARLVQLVWQRSYESGESNLDQQHRRLFAQVNALLAALLAKDPAADAQLKTLLADVEQHFAEEEAIVAAAGFPGAARHAQLHRELSERASQLQAQRETELIDAWELFQFLAHDVIAKHMLGADREFFPYLQSQYKAIGQAGLASAETA